jgi:chromosome segregation ATPase
MDYLKNWHLRHTSSLIIVCLFLSIHIHAQTDKNEIKLQNLKNKIALAESKVAAAEMKKAVSDSIINDGDTRISQAEAEYARVFDEQKKLEKEYRANSKALNKLAKSKDAETAKKAEDDLKALNLSYKEDAKSLETEIKNLTKQAARAKSDVDKGLDMQKAAIAKLKDAQKALEVARDNYEDYLKNM